MKFRFLVPMVSGAAILAAAPALAASDVSNSASVSNQVVASVASPVASSQTASLIGGSIGSSLGASLGGSLGGSVAPSGGFTPAPSGGFSPSGGGGGTGGGGLSPSGGSGSQAPGPTSQILNTRQMGKAGAAGAPKMGAWAQGTYVNLDKKEEFLQMSGNVYNVVGGLDYKFTPKGVAGVAVGYEMVDIDTGFNQGTYEGNGVTVAPYVGYAITPNWSVDGAVGYSWLNYDVSRTNGAVKGSYGAERWFASANVNGNFAVNRWVLNPRAGVVYVNEKSDAYNETGTSTARVDGATLKSGRASASMKFGYLFNNFLPYGKIGGEWDFEHADAVRKGNGQMSNVDEGGMTVAVGVDLFRGPISGSVEAAYNSLLREDLDLWQGTARIRYDF